MTAKIITQTATSKVQVYKIPAPTMKDAFQRLKAQHGLEDYHLKTLEVPEGQNLYHGFILKQSQKLHNQYLNNKISEFTIFGALYNNAPKLEGDDKIIVRNITSNGTKKWETINSYRTDSGEIIEEDISTKAEALETAKGLAQEQGKTINVVLSKRLASHDGILGIAEVVDYTHIDTENVYVFWKYGVTIDSQEEDDLIDDNIVKEDHGQLAIKDNLVSFFSRKRILKQWRQEEEAAKEEVEVSNE